MIERLSDRIEKLKAPIVVGLDPNLNFIPKHILDRSFREYGKTLEGAADSFFQFNKVIIDSVKDIVPAVKPQIAMYEQLGIPGFAAFKKTVDYAHEKGLLVIGDVKRGDIGNTSKSYAEAHIGSVLIEGEAFEPFGEDFATVNPYLGSDGIEPFVDVCKEYDKGIFVLVKTSNKSSGEFQDRLIDGKPLYEHVAEAVHKWGLDCRRGRYSDVGAVVGATYPEVGAALRQVMPQAFILVPGYGAQGGRGEDLVPFFNEDGLGAIVNSSRGIIAAWKDEKYERFGEEHFGDAAREAVFAMKDDIETSLAKALN